MALTGTPAVVASSTVVALIVVASIGSENSTQTVESTGSAVPWGWDPATVGGVWSGASSVVKSQVWLSDSGFPLTSATPPAPPRTVAV